MTVVFQGERGAYSEAAARLLAPDASPTGVATFERVFDAVAGGEALRGVVPVENTVGGSIGEVQNLIVDRTGAGGVSIVGELWHRIDLTLQAMPGASLDEITQVRSHPQALLQGADFLDRYLPQALRVPTLDTAGAARQIAAENLAGVAAIASAGAAELYGLRILAQLEGEDRPHTRFMMVASAGTKAEGANKSTLVLTPSRQAPNAFFRALTTFVGRRLALYRIEPRPRRARPGQYHYLVDVEGNAAADPLAAAIVDAQAFCDRLAVAGSYRAADVG